MFDCYDLIHDFMMSLHSSTSFITQGISLLLYMYIEIYEHDVMFDCMTLFMIS